jgi:hypothetical protein
MPSIKTRYVALCQQLLVLGVVVAALVPAAGIVTLDVVREKPATSPVTGSVTAPVTGSATGPSTSVVTPTPSGALAAYVKAATTPSVVPTSAVDPTVDEVQLTAASAPLAGRRAIGAATGPATPHARVATPKQTGRIAARVARDTALSLQQRTTVITSTPQRVTGYGTVGVTWQHGDDLKPSQLRVQVRTEKGGVWGAWQRMDYDVDGPDADSADGRASRPGTMEALVGHVDRVQVRMTITGASVPPDMKLAVIDPGTAAASASERPALDTSRLDPDPASAPDTMTATPATVAAPADATSTAPPTAQAPAAPATPAPADGAEQAVLAAAAYTPKPQIYSRAQWGADERVREQTPPSYAEVHGGFVHHTVNANDYTPAEVPGIIRSIYAYHVKSRGWRDIGYNFLIDKFGRIWEGRYGGVDRPVVGAHTENYNDYGFGVSAIGNFEIAKPGSAIIQAEGALFAWKLSLHGVSAAATNVAIGPRVFSSSIMGHRDTKSTACPGKYLYQKIPKIRALAASLQVGWSGRDLESNIAGSPAPDLVVRNATNKQLYVVSTTAVAPRITARKSAKQSVVSPDLTGDGKPDLVKVNKSGVMKVRPGDGAGHYGAPVRTDKKKFVHRTLVTAVGDLNGDGKNDLVAKITKKGKNKSRLSIYLGQGNGTFVRKAQHSVDLRGMVGLAGPGDVTGDGHPDLVARRSSGASVTLPGTGAGTFGTPVSSTPAGPVPSGSGLGRLVPTGLAIPNANLLLNAGDWNRDGFADLITRNTDGNLYLYLGNGQGQFAAPTLLATGFGAVTLLTAAGDITGDGWPDLQGQLNGSMQIWPGQGSAGVAGGYRSHAAIKAQQQVAVGRWDGDGAPDALFVKGKKTVLYPGNGPGGLTNPITVGGSLAAYDWVIGVSNLGLSGAPGLIVQQKGTGNLYQIARGANGQLAAPVLLGSGFGGYDLAG